MIKKVPLAPPNFVGGARDENKLNNTKVPSPGIAGLDVMKTYLRNDWAVDNNGNNFRRFGKSGTC